MYILYKDLKIRKGFLLAVLKILLLNKIFLIFYVMSSNLLDENVSVVLNIFVILLLILYVVNFFQGLSRFYDFSFLFIKLWKLGWRSTFLFF